MAIKINDRITLKNNLSGVIRYIGPIEGRENEWVGIELEEAKGSNNGSVDGQVYFRCQPKHGIFVKYNRLASGITELSNRSSKFFSESEPILSEDMNTVSKNQQNVPYNKFNMGKSFESVLSKERMFETSTDKYRENDRFNGLSEHRISSENNSYSFSKKQDNLNSKEQFRNKNDDKYENFLTSPSLFEVDMYGEDNTKILEKKLEILKNENLGYRKLIKELSEKCNSALDVVYQNLEYLNMKITKIKIITTDDKERSLVVNLVSKIYEAEQKGDSKTVLQNFEKFKNIMSKYNIKVE